MLPWKCRRTTSVCVLACVGLGLCSLHSCVRNSVLSHTGMILRFYVCGDGLALAGSCLRAWALTCVHEMPGRSPTLPIFTHFSIVSFPYAILTHLFVNFASKYHCIILFIFTLASKHYIPLNFAWIINLMTSFFLQSSSPYDGRGSSNNVVEWFNLLTLETRGYIREVGFEPIIGLLPEKSTSATLVECLIKKWWDTTHTFHITKRGMTVTHYNFYHMTGLSFKRAIISLDSVLGIQLGIDMLERKYSTETIRYFDLV